MVRGATPDVVLTGVELLARGLDDDHPGAGDVVVVDVGGATTDVHSVVELDPEDERAGPRGGRHHAGHPHRRGRPRHALVGGHHGRGRPGLDELADGRRAGATTTRRTCPTDDAERRRRRGDRPGRRRAGPAPARRPQQGRGQPRGPGRRAHRQGPPRGRPARRAPAGCCATAGRESPSRVLRGQHRRGRRGRLAAAPARRASWSTATTCWPRPGCSPPSIPWPAHRLVATPRPTRRSVACPRERRRRGPGRRRPTDAGEPRSAGSRGRRRRGRAPLGGGAARPSASPSSGGGPCRRGRASRADDARHRRRAVELHAAPRCRGASTSPPPGPGASWSSSPPAT